MSDNRILQPSAITIVPSVSDIFLTLPKISMIAPPLLCSSGTKYLMRTSGCSGIWSAMYAKRSLIACCSCSSSSGRASVRRAVSATASSVSSLGSWTKSAWKSASSRFQFYGMNRKSFSVSSNATQLLAVGIIPPPFLFFVENVRCRTFLTIKKRRSVQRTFRWAFQGGVGIVLRKNTSFNGCCHSKSYDG